jgi:hypothetical protein
VIQALSDRDLELKSRCKGRVFLEISSHITSSCIVLSNKKSRANIQKDGRKSDENVVSGVSTEFTSNLKKSREFSFPLRRTGLKLT